MRYERKEIIKEVNSVFEQPWWMDTVSVGEWKEIVIKNKNGECMVRVPYSVNKILGMHVVGVPLFTQQLGPWFRYEPGARESVNMRRIRENTLMLAEQFAEFNNVDFRFHGSFSYVLPFIWKGFSVEPCFSYIIEDLTDLDVVYKNMDDKQRKIRNALNYVHLVNNVECEDFIDVLKKTYLKQNRKIPVDVGVLKKMYSASIEHKSARIIGAVDNDTNKLVAAIFLLYDEHCCYYILGGKDYDFKVQGTVDLLLWEGIKFASTVSKSFDFEGSMVPTIERFFRGFGGKPRIYFRVCKGNWLFRFYLKARIYVKRFLGYKNKYV